MTHENIDLTREEKRLLSHFRRMDEVDRETFASIAETLAYVGDKKRKALSELHAEISDIEKS